jgi:phosphoglycerate dehydrogenase-like enzyme
MTLKVHFPKVPAKGTLDELLPLLPPTIEVTAGPETPQPADCDILITGFVKPEHLAASAALRAVIVPFAGVPVETQTLLRQHPQVALHNLHFNDIPTAEMALALLFAASKYLVPLDRQLRSGDWRWDDDAKPTDIFAGKTALILGYGAIGRRLAPVCQALGMQVIGVRRSEPPAPVEAGVHIFSWMRLGELLPRADVLLCVLPETPETTGLLDAGALARLPAHCLLVNVGRGRVIDEEALYLALRDGRIKAAGIDVWYNYPKDDAERGHTFPSKFPFHELDNVVMTPHRAGWLYNFEHLRAAALAEMLVAAVEGRPMPNEVNKELGY